MLPLAHVPSGPHKPKQHVSSGPPGDEHGAPGRLHEPPSGTGGVAHHVWPMPSAMHKFEQHESACTHVEPVERHDVPPPPAKHVPLSQSPLQQFRSCVQNAPAFTHACVGLLGFVWQYAPSPSSSHQPVQQSLSFEHGAPIAVSAQGCSALEHAATTKRKPVKTAALRMAAQP